VVILELKNDQGSLVTQSLRDNDTAIYVDLGPSAPINPKLVGDLQIGDRVAAFKPRSYMELVNARVI
jgi:hypothetical protein